MLHVAATRRRVSRIIMLDGLVAAALMSAPPIVLHAAPPAQGGRAMMAQPATVTVPPVKGLPADSADSVLKRRGLRAVRVPRRVMVGVAGNVLDQSPAAGRTAKRNDFDTIYVAVVIPSGAVAGKVIAPGGAGATTVTGGVTNVPKVSVPRLTGLLPAAAESTLRAHRLALRGVESRPSDASNDGRVIDQSIRPDTSVFVGTPIGVVLGSYAPPPPPPPTKVQTVPVPDLVKRTLAVARELVRKPGLRLRVTSTTPSLNPAYRDSIVLTQDPPYPRQVALRSVVDITIIAFSQALSDSAIAAQRDGADRARRDSIDRVQRDSLQRARDDSIAKARQDSARVSDSIARANNRRNTTGRGSRGETPGRPAPPATPPRMVTVPVLALMPLRDARVRAGDSLRVVADVDADENSIVKTQNLPALSRVPFGTSVRLVVEPAPPAYWKWILIVAGLAALGGIALGVKLIWPSAQISPTPSKPYKPPTSPERPPPTPAITTGVSGDAPHVSLRSDHHDLRGPEIELHSLAAVMSCDIAVDGSSLTLEDDLDAQR